MEKDLLRRKASKNILGRELSGYTSRLYNFRERIVRGIQRNKFLSAITSGQGLRGNPKEQKTHKDTLPKSR